MRFGFVVTTWNGARLVETISHIPKGSRCLVVDNSQTGWTLARAWNYGAGRLFSEGYDVAIVCNDDIVLRPDTGELLATKLLELESNGYVLLSGRHAATNDHHTDSPDWTLLNSAVPALRPGPDFALFAITHRTFDLVGSFDEKFVPCWHEDNDYHRRIDLAGYQAGAYAPYWHYLNGTLRTDPERQAQVRAGAFEASKAYYIRKWGGIPGQERFVVPYGEKVGV